MSGFLDDHDDFELARRLRRAAGATPDVYVAYDSVMSSVGAVRRRRRLAATATAGVVLVMSATSYVLNLRTTDRRVTNADATTDVSVTTEPAVLGPTSTFALPSTTAADGITGGTDGTAADATDETPLPTVEPATTASTEPDPVATPAPTLAPQSPNEDLVAPPAPTAPPATTPTTRPKPPPTTRPTPPAPAPATTVPATVPPATEPPVETTTPTTTPETVPPTAPPTTPPPTTPATEPPVPVPFATRSTVVEGNQVTATYQNGQMSIVLAQPADGWTASAPSSDGPKHARVRFTTLDGSMSIEVNANYVGGDISFS